MLRSAIDARSAASGTARSSGKSARWFGTMCRVRANQKFEIVVSTRPLPGIGSGSTTSKALSRSVVTISM